MFKIIYSKILLFMGAAAHFEMRAKVLSLLQGVGQMSPQGFGQKERRHAAHHRHRAHYDQGQHVAVAALKCNSAKCKI